MRKNSIYLNNFYDPLTTYKTNDDLNNERILY